MPKVDLNILSLAFTISVATAPLAGAQPAAPQAPWTECARRQINVTGPGYTDHQTHTWTIASGIQAY